MLLVTDQQGVLYSLDFEDFEVRMHKLLKRYYGEVQLESAKVARPIREALENYFDGDFHAPAGLSVGTGGTDFQCVVWNGLKRIAAGQTTSYGQLAQMIGRPSASRAVGLANAANPIAIVVPCHRVIGANGTLTGYGGGLARKQWLLEHEQATNVKPQQSQLGLFAET